MKRRILLVLVTVCLVASAGVASPNLQHLVSAASAWVERRPVGDVSRNWLACASDATGQRLLAGDNGGRLWVSADYGETWSERGPVPANSARNWQACASDSDGSVLIAAVFLGRLYRSANYGASWTEAQPAGNAGKQWKAVASDADGSTLISAVYGERLWLSRNGGASWSETRPMGDASALWQAVACDASGLRIIALTRNARAYVSTDAGATWSEVRPAGDANRPWKACAMSVDSLTIVLVTYPSAASVLGRLYRSADAGATWVELQPDGNVDCNWQAVAVDADGSHIVAAVDGGSVWTSSDGGATWSDARPGGVTSTAWQSCASNADGSRAMAGADVGRLYTAIATWSLSYACTEGGAIVGTTPQTVSHGGSGTQVTATPATGYHFVGWSDANAANPRTDTNVTADVSVTAIFAMDMFVITASAGERGNIAPSGDQSVPYGTSQTFTITPEDGYHVEDVVVDGNSVGAVPTYTFTNVMANHTIAATFDFNFWVITVGANSRIVETTPWSQSVTKGADAMFRITPTSADYSYIYSISRNGAAAAPLATGTDFFATRNYGHPQDLAFTGITGDTTVVVNLFCRGDVNGPGGGLVPDGRVDGFDASILIAQWRRVQGEPGIDTLVADLDNNTKVDVVDLSMMMSLWQP
jgi:uncharacterized repeat protein (TIGR02543 family)